MSSKFIQEIEAVATIDTTVTFDTTFAARTIDELLLDFDPKHSGPPICVLTGDAGATKEIHMPPSWGREGHFAAKLGGPEKWVKVSVRMAKGKAAKLKKIKLIGGADQKA
jgi:hypothetical protein